MVRLPDDLAAEPEARATRRRQGRERDKQDAPAEALKRRRGDPKFMKRVHQIIEEDRQLPKRELEYLHLADSALHAPSAGFGGDDIYPDLIRKAEEAVVATTACTEIKLAPPNGFDRWPSASER